MSINNSPLLDDVNTIREAGLDPRLTIEVTLFNDDFNFSNVKVLSRYYAFNTEHHVMGDFRIVLEAQSQPYLDNVVANRRNLKARVVTKALGGESTVYTYKAFLLDNSDGDMAQNSMDSTETKAAFETQEFEIQLFDPIALQMKQSTVQCILRQSDIKSALQGLYYSVSENIGEIDGNRLLGIDIVDLPEREWEQYEHLIVPEHTPINDVIPYLQSHASYGIYPSGISRFYYQGIVYLYPTYNVKRFDSESDTLTINRVPSSVVPTLEHTYRLEGDALHIATCGKVELIDDSEIDLMATGNVFRSIRSKSLFEYPGTREIEAMTLKQANHTNGGIGIVRKDEATITRKTERYITDNVYPTTELIAKSRGRRIKLTWENADHRLLHPGMAIKYRYWQDDTLQEVTGVLAQYHVYTDRHSKLDDNLVESVDLTMFVSTDLE